MCATAGFFSTGFASVVCMCCHGFPNSTLYQSQFLQTVMKPVFPCSMAVACYPSVQI